MGWFGDTRTIAKAGNVSGPSKVHIPRNKNRRAIHFYPDPANAGAIRVVTNQEDVTDPTVGMIVPANIPSTLTIESSADVWFVNDDQAATRNVTFWWSTPE